MARRHNPLAHRFGNTEDELARSDADRQTSALAGLAFALALVVAGLFLFKHLTVNTSVEYCLTGELHSCDLRLTPSH